MPKVFAIKVPLFVDIVNRKLNWIAEWHCYVLRSDSKLRIIASNVSPIGGSVGLKIYAHWEQPQPRKRGWSIHASSRGMAALYLESHAKAYKPHYLRPSAPGRVGRLARSRSSSLPCSGGGSESFLAGIVEFLAGKADDSASSS